MYHYYVTVSGSVHHDDNVVAKDDSTPIVICIPGLTSDSSSPVSYPIMLLFICVVKCLCCLVSLSLYSELGKPCSYAQVRS